MSLRYRLKGALFPYATRSFTLIFLVSITGPCQGMFSLLIGTTQRHIGAARPGDWVRRMRFWKEITREVGAGVCLVPGTRAFPSKARSPDTATMPNCAWSWAGYQECKLPLLMRFGLCAGRIQEIS